MMDLSGSSSTSSFPPDAISVGSMAAPDDLKEGDPAASAADFCGLLAFQSVCVHDGLLLSDREEVDLADEVALDVGAPE